MGVCSILLRTSSSTSPPQKFALFKRWQYLQHTATNASCLCTVTPDSCSMRLQNDDMHCTSSPDVLSAQSAAQAFKLSLCGICQCTNFMLYAESNVILHLPMGPSVASKEKTASLNSFFRFSPRHKASLTANRNSSGNSSSKIL